MEALQAYFSLFLPSFLPSFLPPFFPPLGKDTISISAGQDANWLDPLAQMMMTMAGFRQISERMVELAEEICGGRLVMLQEGGYSAAYVPYCTVAAIEPLLGVDLGITDLYETSSELERYKTILTDETLLALKEARSWHRQWWKV